MKPKEYDAVLGGKNSYLIYAAVLGGIDGLLMRLNDARNSEERILILSEINRYNTVATDRHNSVINQVLKTSISIWNEWRENNPNIVPNLAKSSLIELNIVGANLKKSI